MFYQLEINREFVISPAARRVYLGAALLTFTLFVCRIGTAMALAMAASSWTDIPALVAVPLRLALIAGIFGAALLWVAMAYYWYGFDSRSDGVRGVWLLVLLALGPLGALIYFFAVYRPRTRSVTPTG
jgi:hypothetical protein